MESKHGPTKYLSIIIKGWCSAPSVSVMLYNYVLTHYNIIYLRMMLIKVFPTHSPKMFVTNFHLSKEKIIINKLYLNLT